MSLTTFYIVLSLFTVITLLVTTKATAKHVFIEIRLDIVSVFQITFI